MGAWDVGAFDNDDALDWITELEQTSDSTLIISTFEDVTQLERDEYLEAPECCRALAAAEIVASCKGHGTSSLLPRAGKWIDTYSSTIDAVPLVPLAIGAIKRIKSDSELRELWDESIDGGAPELAESWHKAVADLEERLKR